MMVLRIEAAKPVLVVRKGVRVEGESAQDRRSDTASLGGFQLFLEAHWATGQLGLAQVWNR